MRSLAIQDPLLGPSARTVRGIAAGLLLAGMLLALPGCRTAIPARDHGPIIADPADESRAWAAVLPTEGSQTHADLLARRDDPYREAAANLPQGFWPEAPTPSLRHPIRIYTDRAPERSLFFRREQTVIRRVE